MNILLLNPPFMEKYGKFSREQRSPAVTKSGTFYYPMWLAYATGLLEEKGFNCMLLDCPASGMDMEEVEKRVREFKPDMIVVDTSTPSIYNDIECAVSLADKQDCFIVLVGPHVSAMPEESLKINSRINAVAMKEYEYTILELAEKYKTAKENKTELSSQALSQVKGIAFRDQDNVTINEHRPLPEDLDALPFVSKTYKKHLDYKDYFYAHSKHPIVVTITGRGCPHRCVYCVYPQVFSDRNVRFRSVPKVVDEIEYILNNFKGIKEIMFEDDTLTVNKKRAREFAEEILRRKLKFVWSANSRADVDPETLKILRKAGCRLFCVGIESGDQTVLDSMKKNISIEKIRGFFKDCKTAGIKIHGCFMVGNPSETKESLRKTLDFAKELNPDTAQFFPIMVYPGTEAYKWAKENKFLVSDNYRDWLTPNGLHNCMLSRPGLSNIDLVSFCDNARKEFYLRPSYIFAKILEGFKDPAEFKRLAKGGWTLSKYLFNGTFGKKDKCRNC